MHRYSNFSSAYVVGIPGIREARKSQELPEQKMQKPLLGQTTTEEGKTDSVFRRYNIVDERDVSEAAALMDQKAQISHNLPTEEKQPEIQQQQGVTIQ